MLKDVARRCVRSLARLYYPRIEVTHPERIPERGGVLLVANHPNSLLDAVVIGIAARRPVRFLAKAPLFDVPILGRVMSALGMLPAYRGSDDPGQVARNAESLSGGAEIIKNGDALGLFPEGKAHDATKVEMVRSGAARIAMQALNLGVTTLKIVPIGINYEHKERFRSSVWVQVGEPINVVPFLKEQNEEDESKLTRRLTAEIDRRLRDLVVHLNEERWEPFLSDLEMLLPPPPDTARDVVAPLRQRKRIAGAMNYFLAGDRPRAESIAQSIEAHRDQLKNMGLTLQSPIMRQSGGRLLLSMLSELLWVLLFFVPALVGLIHHLVPFAMVRLIATRVQTPGRTTVSLARLGLSIPIYAAWYAVVLYMMSRYEFRPWAICAWLLPMPLAGILALGYWPRVGQIAGLFWHQLRLACNRTEMTRLRGERERLGRLLRELQSEYARVYPMPARTLLPAPRMIVTWRRFLYATSSVACLALLAVIFQLRDRPIEELNSAAPELHREKPKELAAMLDADERSLRDMIAGLNDLEIRAIKLRDEFAAGKRDYHTQADNDAVRSVLLSFINYRAGLFRLVWKYQNHAQIGDERLRLRAFLCNYTAASALHEAALKLIVQFGRSPETIRKLNEGDEAWGVPPFLYDKIRRNMTRAENNKLLADAFSHYTNSIPALAGHGLVEKAPYNVFHAAIQRSAQTTTVLGPNIWKEKVAITVNDTTRAGRDAAYRIQSLIATWVGDTKIRAPRGGKALIGHDKLVVLKEQLKPGDILLERRNWFLSNAFLPGYWPHAALYCGTHRDVEALGLVKDPRVAKHWAEYSKPDHDGHEHVIIEALSEGIVCATLEHSIGGGDSVAILRPRLPQGKINEAICRAFSHMGKAYDFEFDFFSTDKIVCTELVYRAYDGEVQFELVDVMGRKTLPAIEIVRKFNKEFDTDGAQLEFVSFLDGDDRSGECQFCDIEAFKATIDRPGMTWLQGLVSEK